MSFGKKLPGLDREAGGIEIQFPLADNVTFAAIGPGEELFHRHLLFSECVHGFTKEPPVPLFHMQHARADVNARCP